MESHGSNTIPGIAIFVIKETGAASHPPGSLIIMRLSGHTLLNRRITIVGPSERLPAGLSHSAVVLLAYLVFPEKRLTKFPQHHRLGPLEHHFWVLCSVFLLGCWNLASEIAATSSFGTARTSCLGSLQRHRFGTAGTSFLGWLRHKICTAGTPPSPGGAYA